MRNPLSPKLLSGKQWGAEEASSPAPYYHDDKEAML